MLTRLIDAMMGRRRREEDLRDEIASHLAMATRDRIVDGEDPRAARFASLKEFGNITHAREATRRAWGGRWIDRVADVARDVRYALRLLARSPAYSLIVVAVLAVGIGVNIVAFGYYQSLASTPVPGVRDSATLHAIGALTKGGRIDAVSYRDYTYIRDHARAYASLAGSTFSPFTLGTGAEAQRVYGEIVTGNYFEMLGVGAHLGRTLLPSDDVVPRGHPVVVLSHSFWQRRFQRDPAIVGRTIQVTAAPLMVVGVAAPDFHGTVVGLDIDFFVPVMMQPVLSGGWNALDNPQAPLLFGLGRPQAGVDLDRARAELAAVGRALAEERPADDLTDRAFAVPIRDSPQGLQTYSGPLVGLMGVIGFLLLVVVCANVAGLVLVRTLVRRGEIAARLAMGATRGRIARLLLIEGLLLAVPGATLGLLMPGLAEAYILEARSLISAQIYVTIDGGTLVTSAMLLACLAAVLCGLLPGMTASRVDLAAAMSDSLSARGPSTSRLRSVLVVCQVAMALVLMVGAALVVRSLNAARQANPGFDPRNVASVVLDVRSAGYQATDGWVFYERLQDNLRRLDGVESVSLMRVPLLMVWDFGGREFIPEGYSRTREEDLQFGFNIIGPDHFRTLHIPLRAGRDFRSDESATRVAIVNETLARRFWGHAANAVGKRLQTPDWTTGEPTSMTVIGVARDIKYTRLNEEPHPYVYLPHSQAYSSTMAVHVRGPGDDPGLLERVRQRVHAADPNVAILESRMLIDQTNLSFAIYDVAARVLRVVGAAALALAALGIYGLVAYTVKRSAHEIGIRMAIGAARGHIVRRYVTGGVRLGLVGAAIGIAGSLGLTRLLAVILYGVSPTDAVSFAAATGVVLCAAVLAALVPAWRAARVDPLVSLRRH